MNRNRNRNRMLSTVAFVVSSFAVLAGCAVDPAGDDVQVSATDSELDVASGPSTASGLPASSSARWHHIIMKEPPPSTPSAAGVSRRAIPECLVNELSGSCKTRSEWRLEAGEACLKAGMRLTSLEVAITCDPVGGGGAPEPSSGGAPTPTAASAENIEFGEAIYSCCPGVLDPTVGPPATPSAGGL